MPPREPSRRRHPDGRTYRPSAHRWAVAAQADRPYPVEALAPALGIPARTERLTSAIARALNFNRTTVRRYRRIGLTPAQAEAWAARAELHPAEVWPRWERDSDPATVQAPGWLA